MESNFFSSLFWVFHLHFASVKLSSADSTMKIDCQQNLTQSFKFIHNVITGKKSRTKITIFIFAEFHFHYSLTLKQLVMALHYPGTFLCVFVNGDNLSPLTKLRLVRCSRKTLDKNLERIIGSKDDVWMTKKKWNCNVGVWGWMFIRSCVVSINTKHCLTWAASSNKIR